MVIGHGDGLGGALNSVDSDGPEHHALGGLNEDVAGAENLVDGGDRLGAVSESGYGLSAADSEDSIDAGDCCGSKDDGSYGAIRAGGSYQNDLPDTCDSGRNGSHKDGGRINGGATGNVEADPVQGSNSLPEALACEIPDCVPCQLPLIVLDSAGGES